MSLQISSLKIGPENNFTYLLYCPETFEAGLIDPSFEFDEVTQWVKNTDSRIKLKYLIATHGHWDHAGGFPEMLKRYPDAKVVAHQREKNRLKKLGVALDIPVENDQELKIGNTILRALWTPGHTEGGCCYLTDTILFSGDTLFVGQCGRTDLAGGNEQDLYNSLQKLKLLAPTTTVYPGHDYGSTPTSTIKREMQSSPVMLAKSFQEFQALP